MWAFMLNFIMLKTLLKLIFSFGLIYWLISRGELDFSLIGKSFLIGYSWLFAIFVMILQAFIGVYRYKILLELKSSKKIPYLELVKINWIGLFFSSFLMGAISGDIVKLFYVRKLSPHLSKTFLVTSAVLDRLLSLSGLLFISGCFSLFFFQEVTEPFPRATSLVLLNLILFLGVLLALLVLLAPIRYHNFFLKFLPLKMSTMIQQVLSLRNNKKEILIGFVLSVAFQLLGIFAFWIMTSSFYPVHFSFLHIFIFVPIGLIAIALPLSPRGLGVGHAVFANLFSIFNVPNGASLFNLFFLCNLFFNLVGIIPYLFAGTRMKKKFNF